MDKDLIGKVVNKLCFKALLQKLPSKDIPWFRVLYMGLDDVPA
jgi:hypothetical protein